jgi:hypothetical protein
MVKVRGMVVTNGIDAIDAWSRVCVGGVVVAWVSVIENLGYAALGKKEGKDEPSPP